MADVLVAEQPTDVVVGHDVLTSVAEQPPPDVDVPLLAPATHTHSTAIVDATTSPQAIAEQHGGSIMDDDEEDVDLLEARREKDRKRYSSMTPEARAAYNAHRRDLYHKQGESARKRRRERERERYHALEGDDRKSRNDRRAQLERDRYQKLSKEELAARNEKRRERAKQRKLKQANKKAKLPAAAPKAEAKGEGGVPNLPEMATVDQGMAHVDEAALAAEVAERVIAGTNLDEAMEDVSAPTVQI